MKQMGTEEFLDLMNFSTIFGQKFAKNSDNQKGSKEWDTTSK